MRNIHINLDLKPLKIFILFIKKHLTHSLLLKPEVNLKEINFQ